MSEAEGAGAFVAKWRERWPEWDVAQAFVPVSERAVAAAWFALLQELGDAAWAGEDPRPGEAKLGWWMEELHGWSQRRRRHPLGQALQLQAAPWADLGAALPGLLASREAADDHAQAIERLSPTAQAIAQVGDALFQGEPSAPSTEPLLARQLLLRGDASAPLAVRARLGQARDDGALARAWADAILAGWTAGPGARTARIGEALLRGRLEMLRDSGAMPGPAGRLRTLWRCWHAARG